MSGRNRHKNRNINIFLNGLEFLIIAGFIVFIIIMMTENNTKDIPIEQIQAALEQEESVQALSLKDRDAVVKIWGREPSEYIYYKVDEIMDVQELFIVKAADEEELSWVREAVAEELEKQINNFTGYGTDQLELLQKAVTKEKGNYYFYAVGEDAARWEEIFLGLIR